VKKAKTDPEPLPTEAAGLEGRAEAKNLVTIYAALANESVDAVLARFGGQGFGVFKPALGDLLIHCFAPITARFNDLRGDNEMIDAMLAKGAARAREAAGPTLAKAYEAIGLVK